MVDDLGKYEELPRSLVIKSICFFYGKGYTGHLSSSRSFEVGRLMAPFIMNWMGEGCSVDSSSFLSSLEIEFDTSYVRIGAVVYRDTDSQCAPQAIRDQWRSNSARRFQGTSYLRRVPFFGETGSLRRIRDQVLKRSDLEMVNSGASGAPWRLDHILLVTANFRRRSGVGSCVLHVTDDRMSVDSSSFLSSLEIEFDTSYVRIGPIVTGIQILNVLLKLFEINGDRTQFHE
ncbi:hypothetical protein F2Q69_00020177 [Brassica cretica]|uniref:Uncharacterized protein n=1 Tax=Brassica cretica TaxID=69181 RepID=A0A8S9QF27_BRACR|nr:hypothetical protein F2Q69_00020177 [Brassica cretica]